MKTGKHYFLQGLTLFAFLLAIVSCSSQKDTVASRGMQNLTARYNILYNARILVDESERNILTSYRDNYERLIPVYQEPSEELAKAEVKNLDKAIEKVNVIINEKAQSEYVDEAYFLIAKANHLKAQYFNAAEFFDYLYKSYPEDKEKRQAALAWKARALIALDRLDEAETTLDTAFKYMGTGQKSVADVFATQAQLHIYAKEDKKALSLLEKAIKATNNKQLAIRWNYLSGQLHEVNGDKEAAYMLYSAVVKSNAPFEMAFNAKLNRIALEDEITSRNSGNRIQKLQALLKDDKNKQFADQIYYEIGNTLARQGEPEKAREAYQNAVRQSTANAEQKGLAYLSLAELHLKEGQYVKTKHYYDSTLHVLPKEHAEYAAVSKKAANLDILADRLSVIAKEDTLQMLARLSGDAREQRINSLVQNQTKALQSPIGDQNALFNASTQQNSNVAREGKFYFNNTLALSQGFSDFKRRWGNRKLEDNWRRSQKSSAETLNSANITALNPDEPVSGTPANSGSIKSGEDLRQSYLNDLPLTGPQLEASNRKIASAYYDLGNFYKDILNDKQEAAATYEHFLNRFPETEFKLPAYYNLYRLYLEINPQKAEEYKNILLTKHADSPFAKNILDPEYSQKANEQELALTRSYEKIYALYQEKKYQDVIKATGETQLQYGRNKFSAQLAYLAALATGHLQKLNSFEKALKDLVSAYPDDQLVTPLVKQHLAYVEANREAMTKREFALQDYNAQEPRFVEEPEPAAVAALSGAKSPISAVESLTAAPASPQETKQAEPSQPPNSNPLGFSRADSTHYYFVVNVLDTRTNLNSSRFGIGQFNRANYAPNAIKHQLKAINNQNQLIFVGLFSSKDAVSGYYEQIMPLMKQIMKIPADKFNTFIITGENLEKLTDRQAIEKYIEYYHNTY